MGDYSRLSRWEQCYLKGTYTWKRKTGGQSQSDRLWKTFNRSLLALKRKGAIIQEIPAAARNGKGQDNGLSPEVPREEHSLDDMLIIAQWHPELYNSKFLIF